MSQIILRNFYEIIELPQTPIVYTAIVIGNFGR